MTRDEKVAEARRMRAAGCALQTIADRFGISKTTALRWTDQDADERSRALNRANKLRYRGTCRGCGRPTVGDRPNLSPEYCVPCRSKRRREDSRRWILDSFREWHELFGETPSVLDWHAALARRHGRSDLVERCEATGRPWPSVTSVQNIFGSWNAGVRAAGYTPRPVGRYRREDERQAILRAARGTEKRREGIARMLNDGATVKDIARAFGVKPSTMYTHLARMRADGWDLPDLRGRTAA